MNSFKDKITHTARRLVPALLASFVLVSCGGGGGGGGNATSGGNSAVTVQGNLAVAAGDSATKYTAFNSNQSSTPSSAGNFSTAVAKDSPTYTYAISDTGKKVYAAVSTNANSPVTINAQSTAEAMVLLNPLLIPRTSVERTKVIEIVKADAAVKSLATVIESVYSSVADPMSDARISSALTDAVKSVLTSWQASTVSPAKALPQAVQQGLALVHAMSVSGGSSLQIINNDMGALTLANSAGQTLKLELNTVGPMGITTNVDWVVRIVELDPAKIQWTQYGGAQLRNPTLVDIDSLIKAGGYDQKTIIEGAVGSGLLKFSVDPIGKVADSFNAIVFPDNGINLSHDGVYAVIALSGSPFGDTAEYTSVKNSAWQKSLWAEAEGINIASAVIDFVGVGTTFANAAGVAIPDISPLLATELAIIKTELTNNPDYVGTTATAYFVGKAADIGDKLLDYLRPYIHSSISDLQSTGLKKFFHVAVNTAKSVVDVWSGTITIGTRALNYLFNVTPRESGYTLLGTFPGQDTTPPATPTSLAVTAISSSQINLSWAASTDNVGVTGYNIYRGGSLIGRQSTLTYSNTSLSSSTQYCYTVSAYDAAGNESAQSGTQCATTTAAGPPSCTPPQVLQNGQCVTPAPSPTNTRQFVYVATYTLNSNGNFISAIDTATNLATTDKIPLAFDMDLLPLSAREMAVNPAGTRLYVTDYSNNKVAIIDTAAKAVIATVAVGNAPLSVAINPAGSRVYVANQSGDTVSVIDTATNTVITNVPVLSPHDLVINPAGTRLYVASGSGLGSTISVIDMGNNAVIATTQRPSLNNLNFPLFIGFASMAMNKAGTRLYVASDNGFFEIDTSTNAIVGSILVGSQPSGIAVNSDGTRVYVTNYGSGTVSVIDATTRAVIATILAGSNPTSITLNAAETRAYVANRSLTPSILAIDTATNATSTIAIQGYPSALVR